MALSASKTGPLLSKFDTHQVTRVLATAAANYYKGALVALDANGLAVPAAALAGGGCIIGVCQEELLSAGAADEVLVAWGLHLLEASGMAQARVGEFAYASDDQTVVADAVAATNTFSAGLITKFVSATEVWVYMDPVVSAQRGAHA